MNEKDRKLLLIFSICLNIGFIVFTGYGYYKHKTDLKPFHRGKKLSTSIIFETVDLSPRQKEEVERLGELFHANMLAFGKTASPLKIKMMRRLAGPLPISAEEIKTHSDQINQLEINKEKFIVEHFLALRRVLTDEQANTVFSRFAEIQEKWARRIRFSDGKDNR